ncbi:hypothetical protein P154DRAFT_526522 [Amniculicola lignicola CBS 123094]|uniref:Uncharacterized protein n=1 Tax=Amniculicola lignicola CBS 123094 TaxID=1392246 RepID=A0A6A5W2J5_9PLEO|nr:hypothetical protein P154DRAFT_526522 [Amniculicola lignicola CBS 123094]
MARFLFVLLYAGLVWARSQAVLADTQISKVLVPGHNKAYFTRIPKEDQLFKVSYFDIYPNPPKLWNHAFLYLEGTIREHQLPGLSNATVRFSGECPDKLEDSEPFRRLSDMEGLLIRNYQNWSDGKLVGSKNQLLWEHVILWSRLQSSIGHLDADEDGVKRWNCSFETTVQLPDKRILWSFQQDFELRWPACEEDCCD